MTRNGKLPKAEALRLGKKPQHKPVQQSGAQKESGKDRGGDKIGASVTLPHWNFAALAQRVLAAAASEVSGEATPCKAGTLYLVATPIGHRGDITLRALVTLAHVDAVLCEDTRVSGALFKSYGLSQPLLSYHEYNAAAREAELIERLQQGENLALVSDAGMPLVADPGFRLVRACHAAGITVTVCPGPAAVLTALTQAALPQQPFLFAGFLPAKSHARQKVLASWQTTPATLVFYETPQRLVDSLQDMVLMLGAREAAVGRELTKLYEECRHGTLPELAAYYLEHPPKGEIVVMVAPPIAAAMMDEAEVHDLLETELAMQSLRDAVDKVTVKSGWARAEIYQMALALKKTEESS